MKQDFKQAHTFYAKADAPLYNKNVALEAAIRRGDCFYMDKNYLWARKCYLKATASPLHSKAKGLAFFRLGECAYFGMETPQDSTMAKHYFSESMSFCANSKLAERARTTIEKINAHQPIDMETETNFLELFSDVQNEIPPMDEDNTELPDSKKERS